MTTALSFLCLKSLSSLNLLEKLQELVTISLPLGSVSMTCSEIITFSFVLSKPQSQHGTHPIFIVISISVFVFPLGQTASQLKLCSVFFLKYQAQCSGHGSCLTVTRLSSVQFSRSVISDSLRPHGLQHARLLCPSPTPGAYSSDSDAIPPSHPLSSPSPPGFNLSQHQGLSQ